ncbi:Uncharacterised protein [uncultured archaeon]|nr:Uncharacterised protein [uncultured archaeon]
MTGKRSLASIEENNTMLFSPQSMTVGRGYYARNPVVFNSLLSEKISAKNYATETSMIHATDRAKAIDKDLDASVTDSYYDLSGWELLESADIGLSVREDVTEGATHMGVLQGNTEDQRHSAWKSLVTDIDQDFLGTYSIDTKMKLSWPVTRIKGDDDWLPCCSDGYLTMPTYYRTGSKGFGSDVKGVFDCTCFKPPSQAQFSRA